MSKWYDTLFDVCAQISFSTISRTTNRLTNVCFCGFSDSGVEPSSPPSRLASGHLAVRGARGGLLSHYSAFPIHRDATLQSCWTASHQLHVGETLKTIRQLAASICHLQASACVLTIPPALPQTSWMHRIHFLTRHPFMWNRQQIRSTLIQNDTRNFHPLQWVERSK